MKIVKTNNFCFTCLLIIIIHVIINPVGGFDMENNTVLEIIKDLKRGIFKSISKGKISE